MNSAGSLVICDLLAGASVGQRAVVARLVLNAEGMDADNLAPDELAELLARFPRTLRLHEGPPRRLAFANLELAAAFGAALRQLERESEAAATAPLATGRDAVAAILAAQASGDHGRALELVRRNGAFFFMHFHGMHACWRVLSGFPDEMKETENLLVFALAMHALKSGNVSRARHIIAQRFGAEANDLGTVLLHDGDRYPVAFGLFRFLMAMYEDAPVTDAMRARAFELLGKAPLDDHLLRGAFYNAMVEVFVRRREIDAAMEIARRARHHYGAADAHLLAFYIELYLSILSLMRGSLLEAAHHAQEAGVLLAKVPFDTPSDDRLLGLVNAVIRYEQGDIRFLVRFLSEEFDKFAYGEIWPTVAELAIAYGGHAISRHIAVAAARVFLDKWRVQEWRSNRFRLVITLSEVAILQAGNRWREAADLLTAVQSRVNRTWVESAVENLVRLVDPQEIALVMAWLRHLIWEVPKRDILRDQLAELLRNDRLNERQRITLQIWSAHLARRHGDITDARAAVVKALEAASRLGTVMPLVEESRLLGQLLEDKRIRQFAMAGADAREVVRRMRALETPIPDGARRAGLTPQELKVLLLVVEGGTNKYVARQLGLSEVTVKFHLSNVYRKTGCRRRAEAVATAKVLGWVA